MSEAVVVSTARTPIGKAYRGSFNNTSPVTMARHAIAQAVHRAGIEPGEVEDVWMGCGFPEGVQGDDCTLSQGTPFGSLEGKIFINNSVSLGFL